MRFSAPLLLAGRTATGFEVPDDVVAALGQGKRPPVRVSINGYTYRNTVAVMGGRYLVGVSAEHRAGAGVAAGDVLDIELELDTEPRSVTVPPDLAAALAAEPAAQKAFEGLSYSQQNWHVSSVESAKTDETRQRRIGRCLALLTPARPPR